MSGMETMVSLCKASTLTLVQAQVLPFLHQTQIPLPPTSWSALKKQFWDQKYNSKWVSMYWSEAQVGSTALCGPLRTTRYSP